jgi:uncharacterized protein
VAELANGHKLELVVHELDSGLDGPTLSLVGTVMGDQPIGVEIIRRVLMSLDEVQFRGRLRALPVANPYGFQAHTRHNPLDMNNLNRVFPGRESGLVTERLAHQVFVSMVEECDVLIGLHSGGSIPTVDFTYMFNDLPVAKGLGSRLLLPGPHHGGTLAEAAVAAGVRVAIAELGGAHQEVTRFIERGVLGVMNVMKELKMIVGAPIVSGDQLLVNEVLVQRAQHGGLLLSEFDSSSLGLEISGGTELGRTLSPFDFSELETFRAPYERSILALVHQPVSELDAGDYAFMLANRAGARPV